MSDTVTGTGVVQLPVDFDLPGQQNCATRLYRTDPTARDLRLASKCAVVVDNGLFVDLASVLAKSFGRVLYYNSWHQAFPQTNQTFIGEGLAGVEKIDDIWDRNILDVADVFVFPDVLHGQWQVYLRELGKPVWGSALGEKLELNRADSKKWLRDLGLPVSPHKILTGISALRVYLRGHENQHVKSDNRGDMETFFSPDYDTIEPRLDELEHSLGAAKRVKRFVVEDNIDTAAEVGYDAYTIDGRFPKDALFGVESKDSGYIGKVVPNAGLPKEVAFVNRKLAPLFRSLGYKGFWSSEIRVSKESVPYLIDPTCRCPSPPGELYYYLIDNLAEIIWNGAHGRLVEPVYKHQWGAELILKSGWAEGGNWQAVDIPDELRDNVYLHYHCRVADRDYFVPQHIQIPEIGAVVAGGSTPEEAIARVVSIAGEVRGYEIQPPNEDALKKAVEGIAKHV